LKPAKGASLSPAELTAQPYASQTPETLDGKVFHLSAGEKSILFLKPITYFNVKPVENLLT